MAYSMKYDLFFFQIKQFSQHHFLSIGSFPHGILVTLLLHMNIVSCLIYLWVFYHCEDVVISTLLSF